MLCMCTLTILNLCYPAHEHAFWYEARNNQNVPVDGTDWVAIIMHVKKHDNKPVGV